MKIAAAWMLAFAYMFAVRPVAAGAATTTQRSDVRAIVTQSVRPLMAKYGIPGMAVGVTVGGRHYVFNYGVSSTATKKPVTSSTLFEIGSISKTFTANLVSYAQLTGRLSLSDVVSEDFPALRGSSFDRVRLVNLGTHTNVGLPLQFPDDVKTDNDAIHFYRAFKPRHPAGTSRLYANPGIMLLGLIAAKRMNGDFTALLQRDVLTPLGLRSTFLNVPADQFPRYAQGYTAAGKPRRMAPGPLAPEAYGIRTTADDMLRFLDANMNLVPVSATLRRAIIATHTGYFGVGGMTQDLIWEQYSYPAPLSTVLQGNSEHVSFDDIPAVRIVPPTRPSRKVIINKTGSTAGFAAYTAFIPQRNIGIVLLANRSYPIAARVDAGYRIMMRVSDSARSVNPRV